RRSSVEAVCNVDIPDNLATRAAELLIERTPVRGKVLIQVAKRVPMGAGLGGGSSDAAAVLLTLPVLAGVRISAEQLWEIACSLGSDVPFFLTGGMALGLGRGTEVYPLAEPAEKKEVLLVCPGV